MVCQEFRCTPSQAVEELEIDDQLVFDILDLRGYQRSKELVDHPPKGEGPPMHLPGVIRVIKTVQGIIAEDKADRETE